MKVTIDLIGGDRLLRELQQEIEQFQRSVATTFKSEVVPRTPIDTGRARAGWKQRQLGRQQIIENQVPYIERLERGYSRQAPRGFVKQAMTATINKTKGLIK